ncbi:MAG: hypothetical protein ACRDHI_06915 [Actinomycetota bacterium]
MTGRASPRTIALAGVAVLGLVALIAFLAGRDAASEASQPLVRGDPVTGPFEGLGVWVDIYDDEAWGDPTTTVDTMVASGARTLYLQSSNADRGGPFVFPEGTAAFVDAAHDRGVQVVAWYLPHLTDLVVDRARTRAALAFTTPRGDRFDGFALDIESAAVRDPARRSERLVRLSTRLRELAGDRYPLGAIVPSPVRLADDLAYWPGFPWGDLARTYDAVLPMTYYTFRVRGPAETLDYVTRAIDEIRAGVGSEAVPIHVIGGLARDATGAETAAFVRAVRDAGVIGASYYTHPYVTAEQWSILARVNAVVD